jgi:hypothetical protein
MHKTTQQHSIHPIFTPASHGLHEMWPEAHLQAMVLGSCQGFRMKCGLKIAVQPVAPQLCFLLITHLLRLHMCVQLLIGEVLIGK